MSVRMKPLLVIFIILLVLFSLLGIVLNKTVIPAKQEKVFGQLQYSQVNIPDDVDEEVNKLSFTVKNNSNLSDAVEELKDAVSGTEYEQLSLVLNREEDVSDDIENVWTAIQFEMYEIMGQKKYTQLPAIEEGINNGNEPVQVKIEMDETNVYVTITDGVESLYRMLPINSSDIRMWS